MRFSITWKILLKIQTCNLILTTSRGVIKRETKSAPAPELNICCRGLRADPSGTFESSLENAIASAVCRVKLNKINTSSQKKTVKTYNSKVRKVMDDKKPWQTLFIVTLRYWTSGLCIFQNNIKNRFSMILEKKLNVKFLMGLGWKKIKCEIRRQVFFLHFHIFYPKKSFFSS